MRIRKLMEKMGVDDDRMGSKNLRDLIRFHLNMGKTEEETVILVADKAEEVRSMQGNSREQYIDQAMVYMWQRYRGRWPTVAAYTVHSQSGITTNYYTPPDGIKAPGMTRNYYSEPDGIKAPPYWGFFVVEGKFLLSHLYMGGVEKVAFSREELLARFAPNPAENTAGQIAGYVHKNPDPKHQIDPVLVRQLYSGADFQPFKSVWDAFKSLGIGVDAEARKFRLVLKQEDRAFWPQANPEWEFLLKYPRNTERELVQERAHEDGAVSQTRARKNQDVFRLDVAYNCYGICVLTGASDLRCEAAHLVSHARKGGASYLNGIFLRRDLHKLFDDNLCAIDPVTMEMVFCDAVLASDPDLHPLHRRKIVTRNPLKAENLHNRWEIFRAGSA
ncbi:TPA: HNH endonuclease [Citrobacter farmeri]|jgi:hypothetical protein|uniref:HNH endonuclease signature motif containing protein n=1 Tax=Citrobacter TaxID=544 RepID=UPI000E189771|nr:MULTISPECIES: HNH endonuclease signature motif containing protein [Citrobacter]MEC3934053.1 HNH endonuclease signature motif containing protein [Citrobacter farmeri]UBI23166.1 HNH endonuclease [Citrobacter amalonaticus]STA62781.1 Uncharacterised protein [Citrobacter amalonaticus]BCU51037.1 hypothetical protein CIAM_45580 [Citrobacter amalonaticus]HCD1278557.1 HNH endonuclease [Citrobacter amalonaticus]